MCQLLAMNCNTPTDIIFSFSGFQQRGGKTDQHKDGFGIVFFENNGIRIFNDHGACAFSPVAEFIKNYPIYSTNVIAHIRKATQGNVSLENTHPFQRELWGRYWVFAHNGNLKDYQPNLADKNYRPIGTTDSEKAFCYILNQLQQTYTQEPDTEQLFEFITKLAAQISKHGIFNFILSNGKWLIAHASTELTYIIRKSPFGVAKLADQDFQIDFTKVTTDKDKVAVIATTPLTQNEKWTPFLNNQSIMFIDGSIVKQNLSD